MTDSEASEAYLNGSFKRILEGPTPRLIDEWQIAPRPWDQVRNKVDRRSLFGQFILTGSFVSADHDKIDIDKMNAPSFLMVLTGITKYAYKRKDGVYVVPIGCLKN